MKKTDFLNKVLVHFPPVGKKLGRQQYFPVDRAQEFITERLFSSDVGSLDDPGANRCWLGAARSKNGSRHLGILKHLISLPLKSGLWASFLSAIRETVITNPYCNQRIRMVEQS